MVGINSSFPWQLIRAVWGLLGPTLGLSSCSVSVDLLRLGLYGSDPNQSVLTIGQDIAESGNTISTSCTWGLRLCAVCSRLTPRESFASRPKRLEHASLVLLRLVLTDVYQLIMC